jgi:hypothetical protein
MKHGYTEKMIFAQLVKKLVSFEGTKRVITMFTGAQHCSLSKAK